jgi:phage FluMu protein Com
MLQVLWTFARENARIRPSSGLEAGVSNMIANTLLALNEHLAVVERDFVALGKQMEQADEGDGRTALLGTFRAVERVADGARAVRAKCPRCTRPDPNMEYEAVNKLSGVWKLPECPTCRELSQMMSAIEKVAKTLAASSA